MELQSGEWSGGGGIMAVLRLMFGESDGGVDPSDASGVSGVRRPTKCDEDRYDRTDGQGKNGRTDKS